MEMDPEGALEDREPIVSQTMLETQPPNNDLLEDALSRPNRRPIRHPPVTSAMSVLLAPWIPQVT